MKLSIESGGNLIHGCTACYQCFEKKDGRCALKDDMINDCIEKMRQADGIILGSPTYFGDVTPEMKALIDRSGFVSRANGNFLKRKVGAAVVAVRRGGEIHAFDTICFPFHCPLFRQSQPIFAMSWGVSDIRAHPVYMP